jgi:hypothetical protein
MIPEETPGLTAVLTQSEDKPYPCTYAGCGRGFDSPQALSMHTVRMHTHRFPIRKTKAQAQEAKRELNRRIRERNIAKGLTGGGKPRKVPYRPHPNRRVGITVGGVAPSQTKEYKRQVYLRQVARYKRQGLNAQGKPYAAKHITKKGMRNILKAQKLRREREQMQKISHLNGVTAPVAEPATDTIGESARAILVAAQVLRSVSVGLKL